MIPFLLVADQNYWHALRVQVSNLRNIFLDPKIYVVHELEDNQLSCLGAITPIPFNPAPWEDVIAKKGHVTRTSFGKFQCEDIKEDSFMYLDTDCIANREFSVPNTQTLSLDVRRTPLRPEQRYFAAKQAILSAAGDEPLMVDNVPHMDLYLDGAFVANTAWVCNTLQPALIYASKILPETKPRWLEMGYFNLAVRLLGGVNEWNLDQRLIGMDIESSDADLLHFVGREKPWLVNKDTYSHQVWHKYANSINV